MEWRSPTHAHLVAAIATLVDLLHLAKSACCVKGVE